MTKERIAAIRIMIAEHTKASTVDKKTARAALIKEGLYTAKGALSPKYGGKPTVAS